MVKSKHSSKIIGVAQGVNLDLLGSRETSVYGLVNLAAIELQLRNDLAQLTKLFNMSVVGIEFFQSNAESEFLDFIPR